MVAAGVRNWAEFLPELLRSISERLTVVDYFRFGAVCTTWAASSHDGLKRRPPELPFLLHNGLDGESCTLVGIDDRRSRRMGPLPEMRGKWMVGSQDGWLALLHDTSEASLFNPLTGVHIPLPSITTIPDVQPVYNPDGSVREFLDTEFPGEPPISTQVYRCHTFKKIVFSSSPTPAAGFTAMAIFSVDNYPAITTDGGQKWTVLKGTAVMDIIYRKGNFLLVSYTGELWSVDPTLPSPQKRMIAAGFGNEASSSYFFLVDSSDDLLQVWYSVDLENNLAEFKVMKFDPHKAAWVTLKSLGDRSLFLGGCYSISLSAREISALKPNCIYYNEILWDFIADESSEFRVTARDVGVFNMEDGSMDRYLPSDPRLNFPPPLWFTPSFL